MTVTIFVPRDSTALALGANETAAAIEREAKARGIDTVSYTHLTLPTNREV